MSQPHKPIIKGKIVASRFKEAAAKIANDSGNSSGNATKLTRSNSVKEKKMTRPEPIKKRQFSKTLCYNKNSKPNLLICDSNKDSLKIKVEDNLQEIRRKNCNSSNDVTSNISPNCISNKMHSTAVNATMLNTTAMPHGSNHTLSPLELPDISAIKLEPNDFTPPMLPPNCIKGSMQNLTEMVENCEFDVTEESLELAYINYLTWCNLTSLAQASHKAAMDPVMKELYFLEELSNQKHNEKSELTQKLNLLSILKESHGTQQTLLHKLKNFNDGSYVWVENLEQLARVLEYHLHQFSMSSAVLPGTTEELMELFEGIKDITEEILSKVPNCSEDLKTTTSVLEDADELKKCCRLMHDSACYALQKCSHGIET